ncbi:sugar ABC transporter ATP-binding protein [Paracoccus tibetensis]|uniref:Monosaccharide ABC transporter ATP-binding protein, CUT2 family (TC 3.A.1.2.-) n=1 Tax=Paracoccus tibetensis TaxID=336292 RepID=A0A1G5HFA6_9RHOB|nr:sugar ABC transporter ATP-binding protein [Paracoccus tibetensis]SCY62476.1 monosaccharide ABC transporter ATP-binding protein, CUT2 family (TC 3.A.1.2.-) [Paracoccus tibetensis]
MTRLSIIHAAEPSSSATDPGLPPVLEVQGLGKTYGAITVLSGVDLSLQPGEVHAVIGENGAGKSTLMKLLSGHVAPTVGQIRLEGAPVSFPDAATAEQAGIVLVHQEILLADDLTVAENLFLGREIGPWWTVSDRQMDARTREVLARIGSVARPRDLVRDLPLAQRQLVQIARALLDPRKVVIFDEPTAVLAHDEVAALLAIVRQLRDAGAAVLYISHRLDEVEALADRITVLRDGQMIGTFPAAGMSQRRMAELMVGRRLDMLYPPKRTDPGETLLEIEALSVEHGRQEASLTIRAGEVLGIGGMIGAGRTELIEGLMGLRPATARRIALRGEDVSKRSVKAWQKRGVVYLTEDRKGKGLLLGSDLAQNLTLAALTETHPGVMLHPGRETRALEGAVSEYDIRVRSLRLTAGQLSGGNQQKLLLAKIMLTDPAVVIIDEPTRGIDIGNKSQIYDFIDKLVRDGRACVVISSEMSELVGLADRVLVMRAGRVVAEFAGDQITEENVVYAATSSRQDHQEAAP